MGNLFGAKLVIRKRFRDKVQRQVDKYRIVELVMGRVELANFIEMLIDNADDVYNDDLSLVMHFLPLEKKQDSLILEGIKIERAATLMHIESAPISIEIPSLDCECEIKRILQFQRDLGYYS